jgi:O-antigen/teichoic acid export membrane protein
MVFKKLFTHSLLYAIGPQVPRLASFLLLPILTKHLTADDYGIYGTLLAYTGALSGLRYLGMQQTLVNSYYKAKEVRERWIRAWRQQLAVLSLWGLVHCSLLYIIMSYSFGHLLADNMLVVLLLVGVPALICDVLIFSGNLYVQLSQQPKLALYNSIISGVVSVVVTYLSIVYFNLHYVGFFIASACASVVSAILFFNPIVMKQKIYPVFTFKRHQVRSWFRVALPTVPHSYSSYLLNFSDRVVLEKYNVPMREIGQYNFAYSFGSLVDMLTSSVATAVSPMLLREYSKRTLEGYANARTLICALQLVFIVGCILPCIWLREVFAVMSSNNQLASAYPLGIIVILSFACRPMYWAVVARLGFEGHTKYLWRITFVGGILNVVLNLIFVPKFGVMASAVSTFIALIYIAFAGFYMRAFKQLHSHNYYQVWWLVLIVLLTIFAFYLKDASIVIKTIVSGVVVVGSGWTLFLYKQQLLKLNGSLT